MAFQYTTLTEETKQSLIARRIQEMEQQHFEHGLTATMLEAEINVPEATAMAAEARKTQATLERGIAEASKLRKPVTPSPPFVPRPTGS